MYGPGNQWNWLIQDLKSDVWPDRNLLQSAHDGTKTSRQSKIEAMRGFIWFMTVALLRNSTKRKDVMRGID